MNHDEFVNQARQILLYDCPVFVIPRDGVYTFQTTSSRGIVRYRIGEELFENHVSIPPQGSFGSNQVHSTFTLEAGTQVELLIGDNLHITYIGNLR